MSLSWKTVTSVATYKDAANGGTEWTKSPVNLAQYVVENDNQIKVFLNPAAIIAAVNNAGRAVDIQIVIQQAIQNVVSYVSEWCTCSF